MELKLLVEALCRAFKIKPVTPVKAIYQGTSGSVTVVCKATQPMHSVVPTQRVTQYLTSSGYGDHVTLVDIKVKVTPLNLAMGERAFYVSIFLAFTVGDDETITYYIGYSTEGCCLHIASP